MDGNNLNKWLTLGANLAVLIGIVLILLELNQNADLMRAQMTQARADNVVESYRQRQHSDHWAAISAKRRKAKSEEDWVDSLTPEEYERAFYYHLAEYHDLRTQFVQYKSGFLDPQIWETSSKGQIQRLARAWRYFFEDASDYADPEFVEYINQVAEDAGLPAFSKQN